MSTDDGMRVHSRLSRLLPLGRPSEEVGGIVSLAPNDGVLNMTSAVSWKGDGIGA